MGLMAIGVDAAALNNAGDEPGEMADNTVAVKKIRTKTGTHPYVSAQAIRYWWRQTLESKYNWEMSPITRETKIAYTEADPVKYPDDDVFGYMRAKKIMVDGKGGKKKSKNVTVTRISPLKNSPLVSVSPVRIVNDFGVMARQQGDPVPYEHQFYMATLKGIFSLDMDAVGYFTTETRAGFHNLNESSIESYEKNGNLIIENNGGISTVKISEDLKQKRIKETIEALPFLFGGAKSTLHLTDVTPQLLVLALFNGGNHVLANLMYDNDGVPNFSIEALKEIIEDYKEEFLSKIYIGIRHNFLGNLRNNLEELKKQLESSKSDEENILYLGTPKQVVEAFLNEIYKSKNNKKS